MQFFANKRSVNVSLANNNNSSNNNNTIRNLLAMNNTTNNSEVVKQQRIVIDSNKQHSVSSLENIGLLQTSIQTGDKSSVSNMSLPILNGIPMQVSAPVISQTMINSPVVSSLSQILDKSNSLKPKAPNACNVSSENNQTINSLLAVLSASSTIASNVVTPSVSSSSSHSYPLPMNPIKSLTNNRIKKSFEMPKSNASSRVSTSMNKPGTKSIKNNSKKGFLAIITKINI